MKKSENKLSEFEQAISSLLVILRERVDLGRDLCDLYNTCLNNVGDVHSLAHMFEKAL